MALPCAQDDGMIRSFCFFFVESKLHSQRSVKFNHIALHLVVGIRDCDCDIVFIPPRIKQISVHDPSLIVGHFIFRKKYSTKLVNGFDVWKTPLLGGPILKIRSDNYNGSHLDSAFCVGFLLYAFGNRRPSPPPPSPLQKKSTEREKKKKDKWVRAK